MGQKLYSKAPQSRAERYRHRAEEALLKAAQTPNPDHRNGYMSMAAAWHEMAAEAEKEYERPVETSSLSAPSCSSRPEKR